MKPDDLPQPLLLDPLPALSHGQRAAYTIFAWITVVVICCGFVAFVSYSAYVLTRWLLG